MQELKSPCNADGDRHSLWPFQHLFPSPVCQIRIFFLTILQEYKALSQEFDNNWLHYHADDPLMTHWQHIQGQ